MGQQIWNIMDITGEEYVLGIYHGEDSGHVVVYLNNNIIIIDFKILMSKTYHFFIGHEFMQLKIVKNKVAPPFRKAEFDIMFGEGISKVGEIVDLGVEFGIVKKSGSWYSYGDSKLAQGRDAVKNLLKDNPDLAAELEEKIMTAMKEKK